MASFTITYFGKDTVTVPAYFYPKEKVIAFAKKTADERKVRMFRIAYISGRNVGTWERHRNGWYRI